MVNKKTLLFLMVLSIFSLNKKTFAYKDSSSKKITIYANQLNTQKNLSTLIYNINCLHKQLAETYKELSSIDELDSSSSKQDILAKLEYLKNLLGTDQQQEKMKELVIAKKKNNATLKSLENEKKDKQNKVNGNFQTFRMLTTNADTALANQQENIKQQEEAIQEKNKEKNNLEAETDKTKTLLKNPDLNFSDIEPEILNTIKDTPINLEKLKKFNSNIDSVIKKAILKNNDQINRKNPSRLGSVWNWIKRHKGKIIIGGVAVSSATAYLYYLYNLYYLYKWTSQENYNDVCTIGDNPHKVDLSPEYYQSFEKNNTCVAPIDLSTQQNTLMQTIKAGAKLAIPFISSFAIAKYLI
ncbi:hypothetical protein ACFLYH_01655 [Candidatus Dependentiae bacterium]